MSVQTELTRIQNAKEAIRTAIIAKGVDVSSSATIDTYSTAIDSIPGGDVDYKQYLGGNIGNGRTFDIPSDITTIGDYAFNGQKIEHIVIPNQITSIGSCAFSCVRTGMSDTSTKSITIGSGLTSISEYAFSNRSGVCNIVTIPNTIQEIKEYAFENSCSYTTIVFENGSTCTTIGNFAFARACLANTSIAIPDSVTTLGTDVFYNSKISACTIGSGITYIPNSTFSNTPNLQSVILNGGVTGFGDYVFYQSSITSYTIPDSVTSIGTSLFAYSSIQTVIFSTGLTSTGKYMFERVKNLNLRIPSHIKTIEEYTFSNASGTVVFDEGCEIIKSYAFQGAYLGSIVLPNSIITIEYSAFYYCRSGITSIFIGSGCTSIGSSAFYYCTGLTGVTITAPTPPTLASGAFNSTNNCPIYVPSGSVEAYKTATNWQALASRIQAITS